MWKNLLEHVYSYYVHHTAWNQHLFVWTRTRRSRQATGTCTKTTYTTDILTNCYSIMVLGATCYLFYNDYGTRELFGMSLSFHFQGYLEEFRMTFMKPWQVTRKKLTSFHLWSRQNRASDEIIAVFGSYLYNNILSQNVHVNLMQKSSKYSLKCKPYSVKKDI